MTDKAKVTSFELSPNFFNLRVERLRSGLSHGTPPNPDDLPDDIRRAITVWLAGNQAG